MFRLSYECFSILCNAFLLESAISNHNSCEEGWGWDLEYECIIKLSKKGSCPPSVESNAEFRS